MRQQAASFDHERAKIKRRFGDAEKNIHTSTALDCLRNSVSIEPRVTGHGRHVMVNGRLA